VRFVVVNVWESAESTQDVGHLGEMLRTPPMTGRTFVERLNPGLVVRGVRSAEADGCAESLKNK